MSVSIQTVEFERREAYLSELDEGPPYTVHGVALGSGDVTVGQSGIKKLWPSEELEQAADSLEGTDLVVDHDNSSTGVVGRVTKAGYKDDVGVLYEAQLFDGDLAEKIDNGLLEVSIRGKHTSVEEMDETEDGAKIVEDIQFSNLSIVPTGAAPSNTIEIGETEELSVAELSSFTDTLESEELQEVEPGMWVQWDGGDKHGVTISQPEDGEVEVDVYEKADGTWRAIGETTTVSTDSLEEWDVDEENIGPAQDEDEEEEDEDEEEAARRERGEGEEEIIDSRTDEKEKREQEPERYTPDEVDELQDYNFHQVDWDGTTTADWSTPDKEDFDTDDLSEIDDHFLISSSGFPPDNFGDLKLPVVEPNGNLNVNALSAVKGGRGVSAVDGLSDDAEDRIIEYVNNLANEHFDKNWGEEDEEENRGDDEVEQTSDELPLDAASVHVLTGDDFRRTYKSGESELDDTITKVTTMTDEEDDIEQKLAELNEPVAVEQSDLEELQEKADRFEEMSATLEDLKERTDILDSVDREQVEELADAEEPVVVESARYEELEDEAEQVKAVYAAALAEEMPAFGADELTDRFSIEELRSKYEEQIGDPEEELASSEEAEPRSGDVDEEELEDRAEEEADTEEAELEEEAEAKREELREKILGN